MVNPAEVRTEDRDRQADLSAITSAAAPDVTDISYQAQMAALEEYAQSAFNEVLAQYRFLGLLAGIRGPNDSEQDVEDARNAVMEALAEVLRAGPLAEQVRNSWTDVQQKRDNLREQINEAVRAGNYEEELQAADSLLSEIVPGNPENQSETWHEMVAAGEYREGLGRRLERVPPRMLQDFQELIAAQEQLSALEDLRRSERRAAIANFFRRIWQGILDYYNENMELIRKGQWLLATGRIAVDAAVFAAEEIVVAGIVTAVIGVTAGIAAGMAIVLRSAVRAMLSVVRTGTRVVRNIRATYVFKIELRKVEPGIIYSNPIPFNITIGRKLNYEKQIDVSKDLTPNERRAMGEGGQGSLEPDVDAPEPIGGARGASDPPPFRHPRDGQPPRSNEELAPGGRVPSNTDGAFERWWDDLSPAELDQLSQDRNIWDRIEIGIRNGGGAHEWLKVSQQLEHKRLGFSMREIQDWVTATRVAEGPLPQPNARGLTRWRHSSPNGRGSGPGSVTMHNALDAVYGPPPAQSRNELLRRMGYFSNHYLDNGIDSLPSGMRNAIINAGGG